MVLCQRTNLKIKRESPNRYNRWLLFDSLIKLKRRICTPSLRQPIHVNMKGDIKMVYLGFMAHGLDREFELDSDLVHDETFEQLIFTIHKLKFTLVIIPRCQSGETSSSPPVATVTATTPCPLKPDTSTWNGLWSPESGRNK